MEYFRDTWEKISRERDGALTKNNIPSHRREATFQQKAHSDRKQWMKHHRLEFAKHRIVVKKIVARDSFSK